MKKILHVVSLSSGGSSAVAADRVMNRYGKENTVLVFADTKIEDDDNYRFLSDLEQFWQKQVIRLQDGRTPYEVATEEHIIPNNKIAPCTKRLKLIPIQNFVRALQEKNLIFMHIGMNVSDKVRGRLEAPRRNWEAFGCLVEFPLLWTPVELNVEATIKSWGLKPPRMYEQGYSHANCGGRCVKQGAKDWRITLKEYPDRFKEVESWETDMRKDARFENYALLRRTENGIMRGLPLSELRDETENLTARELKKKILVDDLGNVCGVECSPFADES